MTPTNPPFLAVLLAINGVRNVGFATLHPINEVMDLGESIGAYSEAKTLAPGQKLDQPETQE